MSTTEPTYCNSNDVIDEYGNERIAEITGDPHGEQTGYKVAKAIVKFASWMNPRIRVRYPDLPFDRDHIFLRSLNVEGAFYELKKATPAGLTEEEEKGWKAVIKELDKIADGSNELKAPDSGKSAGSFSTNQRLFGLARRRPDHAW